MSQKKKKHKTNLKSASLVELFKIHVINNQRNLVWFIAFWALIISFIGIGNNYYWDDEANTAVMGRNFIASGYMNGWDGTNLLAYHMNGGVDKNLRKSGGPPLQYVLAGLSLKIFGDTTAGGRIIFWLIGLLAIPLVAFWYRRECEQDIYWPAALFLALSIAFLLYIRQVRYYPLGITFSLGLLWAWAEIRTTKYLKRWIVIGLVFAALLAASQYLYAFGVAFIIAISLIQKRYRNKQNLIFFGILLGFGVMAILAVYMYSPGMLQRILSMGSNDDNFLKFLKLLAMAPRDVIRFEFFPIGVLLVWGGLYALKKKQLHGMSKSIGWLVLYAFVYITAVSFLSPQPALTARDTDVRYYTVVIPVAAMITALVFAMLRKYYHQWAWGVVIVLATSNVMFLPFFDKYTELTCRSCQYLKENFSDNNISSEVVADFIKHNVNPDECMFFVPMYTSIIQQFYNPQNKICGMVSNQASFWKYNKDKLRQDLVFEEAIPDYFFVGRRSATQFQQWLDSLYGKDSYKLAQILPVHWKNATRPEILWRSFEPLLLDPQRRNGVLIFKRTNYPAHKPQVSGIKVEKLFKY